MLLAAALVLAAVLCGLVAGFVVAFAVVVMPGIRRLDDGPSSGPSRRWTA